MLNVDLVGGCASFRQALGRDASPLGGACEGWPQTRALFKPIAAFLRAAAWLRAALAGVAALFSAARGTTLVGAGIAAVLLNLALLAQLRVAPAFCVSHNQVYTLYAGSRYLLLGILRLRSHTDGEQAEVRETHTLTVENQLLQMVECIHQHTVDSTSGVRRTVVRDMGYESLEIHLAVGYRSGIPLFLTSVLAALWCTLQLTILQCSFLFQASSQ